MISELMQHLTKPRLAFILLLTSTLILGTEPHANSQAPGKQAFLQTANTVLEINFADKSTANGKYAAPAEVIKLKSGEVITHSRKKLIVEAPHATVSICPGAIVIVTATDKLTRILACWENSRHCVTVTSAGSTKNVLLGGELSIAAETDTDEAEKILAITNLRRRSIKYAHPKDGLILVDAQFSLLDIVLKDPILHPLSDSDSQDAKSIIGSINKAAAAITLASSKEPYSLIDQP
ncbi:MAG: hypothetical protein P4L53_18665 [Candidatus Obscuribacterales bacterium]|nr:hypothetical protein [Candidatus Obscuribacterales bacterium]